ncbi:YraN family protein [Natranaerobius thermophilus]|uniref:UPF0102 protein Nther_1376 n=1 Tax=Natranaerobius thermophilus (strain ATCC BAA-1301 / DSM 18059 / JW/NM-WN-LF) TaxID=457570 RepID=Y1376_NATTJ|nr:YraN family protein [Natranaerobius thermophilus]B2A2P1.1 RecName: Full=UPF0102 protein Nther_1376 [Natranaerobius thermophilus JW/NM-WN-LF]ACB84959.1 protein of unknown function UPF0102 [Natranaerobius thermophilus JW/NM-WN-LF]
MNNKSKGRTAEKIARIFLLSKGYQIIFQNYRFSRLGEIDLICCFDNILIFVEVKSRSSLLWGQPEEAVGYEKQGQLKKLANIFLYEFNEFTEYQIRFDVIAILNNNKVKCEISHLRDAF